MRRRGGKVFRVRGPAEAGSSLSRWPFSGDLYRNQHQVNYTRNCTLLRTRHFDMILKLRIVDLKLRIDVLKLRIDVLKPAIEVLKLGIVVLKLSIVVSKLRIVVSKTLDLHWKLQIVVLKSQIDDSKSRIDDSKSQIDDIRRAQLAPDIVPDHATCCTTID